MNIWPINTHENLPMGMSEEEVEEEESSHSAERPANKSCASKMNGLRILLADTSKNLQ